MTSGENITGRPAASERRIAVLNQKGGSGKTATAVNLSAVLASRGRHVLLVDMDPQANASTHLGLEPDGERCTQQLLLNELPAPELIRQSNRPGLDIIPSHINLARAELKLMGEIARELRLRRALAPIVGRYEFVLFDSPPTLGLFPTQVIAATSAILVPVASDPHGLDGLKGLVSTVELLEAGLELPRIVLYPFLTRFDPRKNIHREVEERLLAFAEERRGRVVPLASKVRENVRISEAANQGRDILAVDAHCHGATDYQALAEEVLNVLG